METFAEIGLYISYVLIALAGLGLIVGVGIAVMQNWKDGGMFAIAGIVAIIVFFGIGYVLSGEDISQRLLEKGFGDLAVYKKSSAGIITVYLLAAVASILLVVDLVKGFVNGN